MGGRQMDELRSPQAPTKLGASNISRPRAYDPEPRRGFAKLWSSLSPQHDILLQRQCVVSPTAPALPGVRLQHPALRTAVPFLYDSATRASDFGACSSR